MTTSDPETLEAKRARLRADKVKRDEEAAAARLEGEVEGLELEAKYSATLGKLGADFAMVDASEHGEGFVVVKLGTDLSFRAYVDAVAGAGEGCAPDPAAVFAFVAPSVVHPSAEKFAEITRRRGRILGRTADALASLHGVKGKKTEGKF